MRMIIFLTFILSFQVFCSGTYISPPPPAGEIDCTKPENGSNDECADERGAY